MDIITPDLKLFFSVPNVFPTLAQMLYTIISICIFVASIFTILNERIQYKCRNEI